MPVPFRFGFSVLTILNICKKKKNLRKAYSVEGRGRPARLLGGEGLSGARTAPSRPRALSRPLRRQPSITPTGSPETRPHRHAVRHTCGRRTPPRRTASANPAFSVPTMSSVLHEVPCYYLSQRRCISTLSLEPVFQTVELTAYILESKHRYRSLVSTELGISPHRFLTGFIFQSSFRFVAKLSRRSESPQYPRPARARPPPTSASPTGRDIGSRWTQPHPESTVTPGLCVRGCGPLTTRTHVRAPLAGTRLL